jgi:hypothetical protein
MGIRITESKGSRTTTYDVDTKPRAPLDVAADATFDAWMRQPLHDLRTVEEFAADGGRPVLPPNITLPEWAFHPKLQAPPPPPRSMSAPLPPTTPPRRPDLSMGYLEPSHRGPVRAHERVAGFRYAELRRFGDAESLYVYVGREP